MKGALPPSVISEKQFPKVFAWIARFNRAISDAMSAAPKAMNLQGADAVKRILASSYGESEGLVDESDPLGLKKGQFIEVWPIDSGSSYHDRGRLVALTSQEVVFLAETKLGQKGVRIHCPRAGFRIKAIGGSGAKL